MNQKNKSGSCLLSFALFATILFFSGCDKEVKTLNSPLLKTPSGLTIGKEMKVSGTGYPGAKLLIFVNDNYTEDLIIDNSGSFEKTLLFDSEGNKNIKAKQTLKNIESAYSNSLEMVVDLTPPSMDTFVLENEFPEKTVEKTVEITGKTDPHNIVLLNNIEIKADSAGAFAYTYEFSEGKNELIFMLMDDAGNKTEEIKNIIIIVDTTPPEIKTSMWGCTNAQKNSNIGEAEELICVNDGEWQDYLPNVSIPIEGFIKGDVKSISIDGKNITWDENNEIYVRLNFNVKYGLNKFKVVAEDTSGNKSSKYLEINVDDPDATEDINLNIN